MWKPSRLLIAPEIWRSSYCAKLTASTCKKQARAALLSWRLLRPFANPFQKRVVPQQGILRLRYPVAFIGIDQQLRRHFLQLERRKELQPLCVWHAKIQLSINN